MHMELQKQVCSLELGYKLKQLGVKYDSYFSWYCLAHDQGEQEPAVEFFIASDNQHNASYECSAFTVAELGEMLPAIIKLGNSGKLSDYCCVEFQKYSTGNRWGVMYTEDNETIANNKGDQVEEYENTEADARAKMLIYLIESDIITASDLSSFSA